MSDINLNLYTTTTGQSISKPQTTNVPQSKEKEATVPAETKDVDAKDINNFMANNPATLAAIANINFAAPTSSTGAKVAKAVGETVFGDDIIAIAGNSLKLERYMARVEATPEYQKERIAASMAVLDNEI